MAFINQEPRYSPTDGDRGFVFCGNITSLCSQVAVSGEPDRLQLVAWMDVSGLGKPGSFVSKITTE